MFEFDKPKRDDERSRRDREDLALVMDTLEGRRFLTRQLQWLGYGRELGASPVAVAEYNQAIALIKKMKEARPQICLRILAQCHNIIGE